MMSSKCHSLYLVRRNLSVTLSATLGWVGLMFVCMVVITVKMVVLFLVEVCCMVVSWVSYLLCFR